LRYNSFLQRLPAHGWLCYNPQVLPVLHAAAELPPSENELFPLTLAAKVDIFLRTCELPQSGQVTPVMASLLRTSSSKGVPQVLHSNSKIGIQILQESFIKLF
jgi:hypothetical protein